MKVLWEPNSYRNWTRVFMEGSHYTGELKEGNTIKFMMDDHNGMSSYIERLVPLCNPIIKCREKR